MTRSDAYPATPMSAETVEALQQSQAGTDLVEYLTLEDLKAKA
jgi:hypothetical protein